MRQKLWCLQASAGCLSRLKPSCILISAAHSSWYPLKWSLIYKQVQLQTSNQYATFGILSSSRSFFTDSTLTFSFTPRTWHQGRKMLTAHCVLRMAFSGVRFQMVRSTSSPVRLGQNRRLLSSRDSWKSSVLSTFVGSTFVGSNWKHIFPLKFAQAVLNMEVDRWETVCRLNEVSREKDARRRRETVRWPETTRGKLSVYRLEVSTEGLQLKLVKTPASCQLLLHLRTSLTVTIWQPTFLLTTSTVLLSHLPPRAYITATTYITNLLVAVGTCV